MTANRFEIFPNGPAEGGALEDDMATTERTRLMDDGSYCNFVRFKGSRMRTLQV